MLRAMARSYATPASGSADTASLYRPTGIVAVDVTRNGGTPGLDTAPCGATSRRDADTCDGVPAQHNDGRYEGTRGQR